MDEKGVPRIIHHMWLSKTADTGPPPKFESFRTSFQLLNPTFEYKLWNLQSVLHLFLNDSTLQPFLNMLCVIEPWICKCDVARYGVLYAFGGIYTDLDFRCLRNLDDPMILERNLGVCWELDMNNKQSRLSNNFIVAKRNHPFFLYMLRKIQERVNWYSWWNFLLRL